MMELVYLWVEEYKNIHKQGFNFSPKFKCNYDPDTNVLTIDENDDYIENFFGDNINVTAIVGKNGSGKSSILDNVVFSIFNNQNTLLILKVNKKYYCFHKDINSPKFTIDSKIKVEKISKNDLIDIIYLETEKGCPPVRDDFIETIEQPSAFDDITDLIYIDDYSKTFREQDKIVLSADRFGLYAFEIYGSGNNLDNFLFDFSIEYFHLSQNNKYLYDLLYETSLVEIEKKYETVYEYLRYNIYTMYLFHVFYINNLHNRFFQECIIIDADSYQEYIIDYDKAYKILKSENIEILVDDQEFEEFNNYITENEWIINIENVKNINKNIVPFYNFYAFDKNKRGYSDFSYGEKNIITQLVSLIYKVMHSPKSNVLVVLDEPDISLHPLWQKKYLNQIVKLLLKTNKNVQLIISTHSPFLLSDIPKQNIIFLDTDENGNCVVVDGLKEKKQTFGANIHTLLSDSFFMEDGLMGEFAKGKIDEIIYFHKVTEKQKHKTCLKKIYEKRKTKFWQTQSIIGEEYLKQIIKNHLIEIEKILFGKDAAKREEIERTKAYLERLENG